MKYFKSMFTPFISMLFVLCALAAPLSYADGYSPDIYQPFSIDYDSGGGVFDASVVALKAKSIDADPTDYKFTSCEAATNVIQHYRQKLTRSHSYQSLLYSSRYNKPQKDPPRS